MSATLAESADWCRRLTRRTAGNFYFSFLTLPADRFRDMCALYAFMRVSDDLGDDVAVPVEARTRRLAAWSDELRRALAGETVEPPGLPALAEMVRRREVPPAYLFDVIEGVRSDLHPRPFETFDQLLDYCYHVAGAVGLCCIHVWGFRERARALELAVDCGRAFQLTNILRDLGEDAAMGRVYLPREDLERFGYSERDLAEHRRGRPFERLMEFEVERTKGYYRRAEELHELLSPAGRAIYGAMLGIYRGLLTEIERRRYDVFSRRVRLPKWRKLSIAFGSIVRHRWFGRRVGAVP